MDVKEDNEGMDFWSCYQCHGNNPASTLTTNSIYSSRITDDIPMFAPGEAVCAQCHTVFTGLEVLTAELEGVYDVHKYGYDLEGIYDALVESTNKNPNQSNDALLDAVVYDKETGIKLYGTGSYLDVEMHQGSIHQKMGLSCVDCHMPIEVAEDGTVYRSHNASGSVFESQAAMNMCMTCHTNNEIKTTDDLIAYTKKLQADATDRYFEVREVQKGLRDAIIAAMAAGLDEELIQDARDAYSRGDFYLAYSKKTEADYVEGAVPGTTSIHNYDKVLDYYDKAEEMFKKHTENLK
jgi:nitrite reductase (cytochrome c-552)